jgi:hypothetical protein
MNVEKIFYYKHTLHQKKMIGEEEEEDLWGDESIEVIVTVKDELSLRQQQKQIEEEDALRLCNDLCNVLPTSSSSKTVEVKPIASKEKKKKKPNYAECAKRICSTLGDQRGGFLLTVFNHYGQRLDRKISLEMCDSLSAFLYDDDFEYSEEIADDAFDLNPLYTEFLPPKKLITYEDHTTFATVLVKKFDKLKDAEKTAFLNTTFHYCYEYLSTDDAITLYDFLSKKVGGYHVVETNFMETARKLREAAEQYGEAEDNGDDYSEYDKLYNEK